MTRQSITFLLMHLYAINILQWVLICRSHNKTFTIFLPHPLLSKIYAWKMERHSHTETNFPEDMKQKTKLKKKIKRERKTLEVTFHSKALRIYVTLLFTGIFKFCGRVLNILIVSYCLGNGSGICRPHFLKSDSDYSYCGFSFWLGKTTIEN